jgi:L-amino acid N-acyltransferase YncA/DNA-binding transcriptional ArsR family regulator
MAPGQVRRPSRKRGPWGSGEPPAIVAGSRPARCGVFPTGVYRRWLVNSANLLARPAAEEYAAWFRLLADATRVQIVSSLARSARPLKVAEIVAAVHVGQSTVSQHLKLLAEVRFVVAERRGTARYYRLNSACADLFPTTADLAGKRVPVPARAGPATVPAGITIRPLAAADAARVLAIYQGGLDAGDASFETTAPSWADFDATRLPGHRYVAAARRGGEVVGWVAATAVSDRCAYAGVVEHSVYVDQAARGCGVGAALVQALIDSAEAAGVWTIQSGIFPENGASLRLHERAGFRVVVRERLGRHRGRWRDLLLLERRSGSAGSD